MEASHCMETYSVLKVFGVLEHPINNQAILSSTSLLTRIRQTLHPCPSWKPFLYSCRSLAGCRLMMNCHGYHQCLQPPPPIIHNTVFLQKIISAKGSHDFSPNILYQMLSHSFLIMSAGLTSDTVKHGKISNRTGIRAISFPMLCSTFWQKKRNAP